MLCPLHGSAILKMMQTPSCLVCYLVKWCRKCFHQRITSEILFDPVQSLTLHPAIPCILGAFKIPHCSCLGSSATLWYGCSTVCGHFERPEPQLLGTP